MSRITNMYAISCYTHVQHLTKAYKQHTSTVPEHSSQH